LYDQELIMQNVSALGAFFQPNSVAVVGASSDPRKLGHTVLKNLISMGYTGKIFPINPRENSILDLRCYPSLLDVPEPVEICALIVAADRTLQVAAEMAERKKRYNDILGAICMSAGFAELPAGEARQRELVDILRSASIRLIGPSVYLDQKQMAEEIAGAYEAQPVKKPFLNAVTFGNYAREIRQRLEDAGILTVEHPDTLARIAGNMAAYGKFRRKAVTRTKADKNATRKDAQTKKATPKSGLIRGV
jgi:acyl-CoA synthetase (NDP forming)